MASYKGNTGSCSKRIKDSSTYLRSQIRRRCSYKSKSRARNRLRINQKVRKSSRMPNCLSARSVSRGRRRIRRGRSRTPRRPTSRM